MRPGDKGDKGDKGDGGDGGVVCTEHYTRK